jgi:hypothetical protein
VSGAVGAGICPEAIGTSNNGHNRRGSLPGMKTCGLSVAATSALNARLGNDESIENRTCPRLG